MYTWHMMSIHTFYLCSGVSDSDTDLKKLVPFGMILALQMCSLLASACSEFAMCVRDSYLTTLAMLLAVLQHTALTCEHAHPMYAIVFARLCFGEIARMCVCVCVWTIASGFVCGQIKFPVHVCVTYAHTHIQTQKKHNAIITNNIANKVIM